MKALGIDIGALTTKLAFLDDRKPIATIATLSGDDTEADVRFALDEFLKQNSLNTADIYLVATGAGSKSISFSQSQKAMSTCLARGIHYSLPSVRMVIDMGAESATVLKINERGRLADWANHDKCAAGTGIFLQQMAKLMQMSLEGMSELSLRAKGRADITGTCAVFAESEVISHVHRVPPTPIEDIAAGIFASMVSRIIGLCKRIGIQKDVAVTGGVALNKGLLTILEQELGFPVLVPDEPQSVAALGAAIIAQENLDKGLNK